MIERFVSADYSVAVRRNRKPRDSWRWEIYRAGKSIPLSGHKATFKTMAAATRAGKVALKQLLATYWPDMRQGDCRKHRETLRLQEFEVICKFAKDRQVDAAKRCRIRGTGRYPFFSVHARRRGTAPDGYKHSQPTLIELRYLNTRPASGHEFVGSAGK
jgi:hypothetical protein